MQEENRPFIKLLRSLFSRILTRPDISKLSVLKICLVLFQCLTPDVALSVLEHDGKAYLTDEDFQRISTVLLYYIINLEDLCVSNAASPSYLSSSSSFGNYQFYILALTNLHPAEDDHFLSSSETESILQLIDQHYDPSNQDASSDLQVRFFFLALCPLTTGAHPDVIMSPLIPQCIDATRLLEDVNAQENPGAGESSVPKLAAAIISHILQGHCFRRRNLPSPAFFTDYIFQSLNRTSDLHIVGKFKAHLACDAHLKRRTSAFYT